MTTDREGIKNVLVQGARASRKSFSDSHCRNPVELASECTEDRKQQVKQLLIRFPRIHLALHSWYRRLRGPLRLERPARLNWLLAMFLWTYSVVRVCRRLALAPVRFVSFLRWFGQLPYIITSLHEKNDALHIKLDDHGRHLADLQHGTSVLGEAMQSTGVLISRLSDNVKITADGVVQVREEVYSTLEILRGLHEKEDSALAILRGLHEKEDSALDTLRGVHEKEDSALAILRGLHEKEDTTLEILRGLHEKEDSTNSLLTTLHEKEDVSSGLLTGLHQKQDALLRRSQAIQMDDQTVLARFMDFVLFLPTADWQMLRAYFFFPQLFEPGLARAFRDAIRPGMAVADVGAHIGIFSLIAGMLVGDAGKVFSFEPTPQSSTLLRKNVQINCMADRITVHEVAVADGVGRARFYVNPAVGTHNSLYQEDQQQEPIEVSTASLDGILGTSERLDVVKIDAEGAEPLVLRGMAGLMRSNPDMRIFLEFGENLKRAGVDMPAWLQELRSEGWSIRYVHEPDGKLISASDQELLSFYSVNLSLTRDESSTRGN